MSLKTLAELNNDLLDQVIRQLEVARMFKDWAEFNGLDLTIPTNSINNLNDLAKELELSILNADDIE